MRSDGKTLFFDDLQFNHLRGRQVQTCWCVGKHVQGESSLICFGDVSLSVQLHSVLHIALSHSAIFLEPCATHCAIWAFGLGMCAWARWTRTHTVFGSASPLNWCWDTGIFLSLGDEEGVSWKPENRALGTPQVNHVRPSPAGTEEIEAAFGLHPHRQPLFVDPQAENSLRRVVSGDSATQDGPDCVETEQLHCSSGVGFVSLDDRVRLRLLSPFTT